MDETQTSGYAHPMTSPYCGAAIVVFSPMKRITAASRTCPACKKEFFIENGTPKPS
jgi:hypothetical protein